MNTVLLNQSAASQVIECVPGAHFVFGFPADAAELSRSGNDLVLAFADGASITLEGFYKTYTQQDMPSFEVDGANVAGADFFAALDQPDLMPAAGPEPANDSHYQEWSNMDLLGGLDRLGGLDVGWKDGGKLPDLDGGGGNDGDINYSVNIFAGEYGSDGPGEQGGRPDDIPEGVRPPGSPDPLDPDADEDDFYPKDPTDPKNDPANMSTTSAHLFVREEDLGSNSSPTDSGWLYISAPDGISAIVIDGFTVWQNGALTGTTEIPTDEGYLSVTSFNEASGKLEFTYTLTQSTQEHAASGADVVVSHALPITVTDTDGESATANITVTIKDDIPVAEGETGKELEEATVLVDAGQETELASGNAESSGNVLDNDQFGADGKHSADHVEWGTSNIDLSEYGTLTLNEDGSWKFVLDTASETVRAMTDENTVTVKVPYTIIDADGDTAEAVLTFDIVGADNTVSIITDPDPEDPRDPDPDPTPDPDPNYPDLDDPTVDTDPTTPADKLIVSDAGLTAGSKAGSTPIFDYGSMTLLTPDGLKGIELELEGATGNPVSVPLDGSEVSFSLGTGDTANQPAGTFTAKYANGKLVYSFTLNESHQHAQGENDESWDIKLYVTDADGDKDQANIRVTINDDGPTATNDTFGSVLDEATQFNQVVKAEGDLLENDIFGADRAISVTLLDGDKNGTMELKGKYGTLTLDTDGTYTYVVTTNIPKNEEFSEVFDYRITDADGDSSDAKLSINLKGNSDTPDIIVSTTDPAVTSAAIVVDEGALDSGSGQHTEHGSKGTGTISVNLNGEDGYINFGSILITVDDGDKEATATWNKDASFSVNGVQIAVTDVAKNTDGTWDVTYSYKLTNAQTHAQSMSENYHSDALVADGFTIAATDVSHDVSNSVTVSVSVHDDGPQLSVVENDATSFNGGKQSLTGTFTMKFGADDSTTSISVEGAAMQDGLTFTTADGGMLVLTPVTDGQYAYTYSPADNNVSFTREFKVTIKDADGDTDSDIITVSRNFAPDISTEDGSAVSPGGSAARIDEYDADAAGVTVGAVGDGSTTGSGAFLIDLHGEDGTITLSYGDEKVLLSVKDGQPSGSGTLTVAGVEVSFALEKFYDLWAVTYEHTVENVQTHNDTDSLKGSIEVLVQDKSSDSVSATLDVAVHDHVPVLTVTGQNITETAPNFQFTDRTGATGGLPGIVDDLDFTVNGTFDDTNVSQFNRSTFGADNNKVTISAVRVEADYDYTHIADTSFSKLNVRADNISLADNVSSKGTLYYSNSSRYGITVHSENGRLAQEIDAPSYTDASDWKVSFDGDEVTGFTRGGNGTMTLASEGVKFELGGLAYGIKLNLGAFYSADKDKTGTAADTGDQNAEDCLVIFYNDGKYVGHRLYRSTEDLGKFDSEDGETLGAFIPQGFDTMVVMSSFNGANSDFTITGVDFFTQPTILTRALGTLDQIAADVPNANVIPQFDHADGSKIDVLIEGNTTPVQAEIDILSVEGGNSQMQAVVNGEPLFTAILDQDSSGNWGWSFNLHTKFQLVDSDGENSRNFELNFKWSDADGDAGQASVTLNTEDTTLLGSQVYIDGSELDDTLIGTEQDDSLDGAAGNDFLDGGLGSDILFGGSGSDIFVYDANDALVQGGTGIDILLSDESVTLDSLLGGGKVQDVEVLVKGDGAESLTSLTALADAGITVEADKVTLSNAWKSAGDGIFTNENGTLTVETTLEAIEAAGQIELQSIVGG